MQQPPGYQQPMMAGPPTNTLAIVSLVAGIASFVICPLVGSIVAVITGHMARGQIRQTGEAGREMAMAGLILGYVYLVLFVGTAVVLGIVIAIGAGIAASQPH